MSNSWYDTGEKANQRVEDELAAQLKRREEATSGRIWRYWMRVGDKNLITFVDGLMHPEGYALPFVFNEHQLKLNGSWKNWFTCPGEGCPLCANNHRPSVVAAYTVIDHNEWPDKKGNLHKDELKLYIVKPAINKIIRGAAAKRGDLRGWRVEIMRNTAESQSTGDVFDWEEKTSISDDIQPPNYLEMFTPKSIEELRKVVGGNEPEVDADDDRVKF